MIYRALADVVVAVHFGFVVFVALGGFLAWWWRWAFWPHLAAVVYGVAIVLIGFDCPLTPLEKSLRERGGEAGYRGGFIDHYIEGVLYPERFSPHLRALVGVLVLGSYAGIAVRRRRRAEGPR